MTSVYRYTPSVCVCVCVSYPNLQPSPPRLCALQLDAGVPEKISLVSRDEKSVLVVTYSDLKRCFDSTFQELQGAATGPL